jgi:hypothetical protein
MVSMLRHCLATLAYRGGKVLRGAPEGFASFRAQPGTRTPGEILAHVNDLLDWMRHLLDGAQVWHDSAPQPWAAEVARFHATLAEVDARLAAGMPPGVSAERIFQGPLADALTHVGQIALLRRMAGSPVKGENYFKADITEGVVGPDQRAPRVEF